MSERHGTLVLGLGLWVLALFAVLSLVPPEVLGPGARRLFPQGNLAGVAGTLLAQGMSGAVGVAVAVVPLLPALWGAVCFGWWGAGEATRGTGVLLAVLACVPPLLHTALSPFGVSLGWAEGAWGAWLGSRLVEGTGWLVGSLLLLVVLVSIVLVTQGTAPFRALSQGGRSLAAGFRSFSLLLRRRGVTALRARPLAKLWSQPRPAGRDLWVSRQPEESEGAAAERAAVAPPAPPRRGGRSTRSVGRESLSLFGEPEGSSLQELPALGLLSPPPAHDALSFERELDALAEVLLQKLRTFKVEGRIVGRTTGPVVTQFEVEPASGVKVGRISALADDLALALRAPSVRIVAPIPGKGAVGVEVPNPEPRIVPLRSILESPAYQRSRAELPLTLGEDLMGRPYVADLARMPHLLVAGATGSGKSVCINSLVTSLVYRHPPTRLRFLMVDPKMVELGVYNDLPHLRHPVVTQTQDAAAVLKWLVWEMERRYEWFSANNIRSLRDFNRRVAQGHPIQAPASEGGGVDPGPETFPYVVLVIDELADLILTSAADVERPLALLAQKARATGIHLLIATQRPSVNVITGLIKANFPCRVAFRVSSKVDSRTILDQNGAESLLGNGDMLFLLPGQSEPVRIQGAFISTNETERLIAWYRTGAAARLAAETPEGVAEEEDIIDMVRAREAAEAMEERADDAGSPPEERDPLFRQAAEVVVQHDQGSTSLLQRRLKIGYGRAARIIDQLHAARILGPPEGSKPREVLVTLEELEEICGHGTSRWRG